MRNNNYTDNEVIKGMSQEYRDTWDKIFECQEDVKDILRKNPSIMRDEYWDKDVTIAAYLIARACEFNDPFSYDPSEDKELDTDIRDVYETTEIKEYWPELIDLIPKYQENIFVLLSMLENASVASRTPESIGILAESILDLKKNDHFADFCCGTGSIVRAINKSVEGLIAEGYDSNVNAIALAKIFGNNSDIKFYKKDIFTLVTENTEKLEFDKIFANYPFGVRLMNLKAGREYFDLLKKRIPSLSKGTSIDWLYNTLITDVLSKEGKAVSVMTNGSTWNMSDVPVRKYFIENGLIEAVIELPTKLFNNTNIATSLVVFSHNNKAVRLINASKMFVPGRRINELDDDNIQDILDLLNKDCDESIVVDIEDLRNNDYVLNMNRYKSVDNDIDNGIPFENVIKRITRGAAIKAEDLDKINSNVPTNKQYLMLSNIQNGVIDTELPYITTIDEKNKKYCVSDRSLILSKNGYPYKIAVMEVNKDREILANGNLYIIELDEEKADPYYIAAYLGSEQGTAALKNITVGSTIPNIGVEQLKKMVIPVPEMAVQKKIAASYKELRDELVLLRLKIEKAKERLANILEEGEDDAFRN